jgi:tRNA dimethylallyltransferase
MRVVVITGATATGKTDLAEALAASIGGEVVCADARQVFGELEIGTGKPTPPERAARPHHLFDAFALGEHASAGAWARLARAACDSIAARGATPVLAGGSGLYLAALQHGLHPAPPHDPAMRARLLAKLEGSGAPSLHARLAALDPPTAARLAPHDAQRIVRALEIAEGSGRPLSWWHAQPRRGGLAADWRVLELTCGARELAQRIDRRTQGMFDSGLVAEVEGLVASGRRAPLAALRAIGYDEALAVLDGALAQADAIARTSLRTRQLAKRQRTWFRHQLAGARLDPTDLALGEALASARDALGLPH